MEPSSLSYLAEEGETNLPAAAAGGLPYSESTSEADDGNAVPSATVIPRAGSLPHAAIVSADGLEETERIGTGGLRLRSLAALGDRTHTTRISSCSRPPSPPLHEQETELIGTGGLRPRFLAALGERTHTPRISSCYRPPSPTLHEQGSNAAMAARETCVFERTQASTSSARPQSPPPRTHPNQLPVSHVFVCHGTVDTWPVTRSDTGRIVSRDSLPGALSIAIRSAKLARNQKITLALFDPGESDFREGDIMLFPSRRWYRSIHTSEVEAFLDTAIIRGHSWNGEEKVLTGSYFLVCCYDHGDYLRQCSVCGPIVRTHIVREIQTQHLGNRVYCFACTNLQVDTPGELLLFKADENGSHEAMYRYLHLFPGYVAAMLSDFFADGSIGIRSGPEFRDMWELLLLFLDTGAKLRAAIFTIPLRMDTKLMRPMLIARENLLSTYVERLMNLCLLLRAKAAMCHPGELTFQWKEVTWLELRLVVRSIYVDVHYFRKRVTADWDSVVVTPTKHERDLWLCLSHVDKLVTFGDMLREFVMTDLGGKPSIRPKGLLKPIFGIKIREGEED